MTVNLRTLKDQGSTSLRSRRKKIAPGERSETKWSEVLPGVPKHKLFRARFSGRQDVRRTLSPTKVGLAIHSYRYPGLHSLRSLHPGLNSAARVAGWLFVALSVVFCVTQSRAQIATA